MHDHLLIDDFEIETPLLRTKSVKGFPISPDLTKTFVVKMFQVITSHLELIE